MDDNKVTGTLIWYYYICKREVWLMSRQITPNQDDTLIDIGRFLHRESYKREKKEISLGHIVIDVIKKGEGQVIVGEVKKTSKFKQSAKMQLLYYLKELKSIGIEAKGVLMFPKERKRIEVELKEEDEKELDKVVKEILKIIYMDKPPKSKKIPYCKKCAYNELCYS